MSLAMKNIVSGEGNDRSIPSPEAKKTGDGERRAIKNIAGDKEHR